MNMHVPVSSDEAFWSALRRTVFPLRPSQYDMTSTCNLTCEGCLYFSGDDYSGRIDVRDRSQIDAFFASEAARGIRFGYFGGAEPSLVMPKLITAAAHIPYGTVFTNGIKRISAEIPYRVHVSLWGLPARSRELRGADILCKQIANYKGDRRAVFVVTVTSKNIDEIEPLAEICAGEGIALSFNHYSPTTKYIDFIEQKAAGDEYHHSHAAADDLRLSADDLARSRDTITALMKKHGRMIIYDDHVNRRVHDPVGMHPILDASGVAQDCAVRLTNSLRHFNTDLSSSTAKCCSPNMDCAGCRLYAHSFATLLSRGTRQMRDPEQRARTIKLWRLWCALFLNHEALQDWHPEGAARGE